MDGTCGPEIGRSFCFPGRVLFLREIKRQDYIPVKKKKTCQKEGEDGIR